MKKYLKMYRKEHKQKRREYLSKNKDRINYIRRNWEICHQKERKQYQLNLIRNKRKNNLNFKILCNLRGRLWSALKGICKSKRTVELLGCSIEFLKNYLKKQFTTGMSWSNYGKWHIDHIKPCAKFDMSKESEQKKCFNYKNLQPLWAKDNLRKNKY